MLMKSRFMIGGAMAVLALSACSQSADKAADGAQNVIAATVNGKPISKKQVDMIMKQQAAQGMPDNPEMRKMVIDNLAMASLVAQEAVKKGLDKSGDVADQLEMMKTNVLAQGFVDDYLKSAPVTDAQYAAEYEKIKAATAGNEYSARHILVEKEEDAKAIIAKLKKDIKQFGALAKAQSKDPGSKDKGGELGWFDPRGMVPEFGNAVTQLEKGKFTETPVKSQFGYHVIVLDDSRAKEAPSLEQVKPRLTQQIQQTNLKKFLDELKEKAKIEIIGEKPAASASASASASAAASAPAPAAAAPAASK
ncbi:foldase protein PrsA [Undibacterium fentianense]|uniref:peptidylprolyl isomerase n=1 Tax=Undibacterium fentianense TaxID=2828728 RepID=A0A941DZI6_9BURK|nr:peptidylprolyl isomerase [Undibacterium fentianense]MBR7800394.1 peptidylprolyl isomerase [Undibacterium fentianense]